MCNHPIIRIITLRKSVAVMATALFQAFIYGEIIGHGTQVQPVCENRWSVKADNQENVL
jgi:hypothetical protein